MWNLATKKMQTQTIYSEIPSHPSEDDWHQESNRCQPRGRERGTFLIACRQVSWCAVMQMSAAEACKSKSWSAVKNSCPAPECWTVHLFLSVRLCGNHNDGSHDHQRWGRRVLYSKTASHRDSSPKIFSLNWAHRRSGVLPKAGDLSIENYGILLGVWDSEQ